MVRPTPTSRKLTDAAGEAAWAMVRSLPRCGNRRLSTPISPAASAPMIDNVGVHRARRPKLHHVTRSKTAATAPHHPSTRSRKPLVSSWSAATGSSPAVAAARRATPTVPFRPIRCARRCSAPSVVALVQAAPARTNSATAATPPSTVYHDRKSQLLALDRPFGVSGMPRANAVNATPWVKAATTEPIPKAAPHQRETPPRDSSISIATPRKIRDISITMTGRYSAVSRPEYSAGRPPSRAIPARMSQDSLPSHLVATMAVNCRR